MLLAAMGIAIAIGRNTGNKIGIIPPPLSAMYVDTHISSYTCRVYGALQVSTNTYIYLARKDCTWFTFPSLFASTEILSGRRSLFPERQLL